MKILEQDHPGHFCSADKCQYFRHTDISLTDDPKDTVFCISSIGEMTPQGKIYPSLMVGQWEKINCDTIYEIMVFDKTSKTPWMEIRQFRSNDLEQIKIEHRRLIAKYLELASLKGY